MTNNTFFQNKLTGKEQLWGWRYLLFQTVFLPCLLSMLPLPLSAAGLNLLFFSINLCAALLIFHRYLRHIFPIPGKRLLYILGISIVFFALYQGCSFAIGYLLSSAFGDFANVNDQSISAMAAADYPLMFLSTVLLAPVTEECFYRGLVFRGLYDRAPWAGWIVSVILFGHAAAVLFPIYPGRYLSGSSLPDLRVPALPNSDSRRSQRCRYAIPEVMLCPKSFSFPSMLLI